MTTITATQEHETLTGTAALAALHPSAPRTLEETGLSQDFITQLLLKVMHFGSDNTGLELANRVGLQFPVIEPVLEFLKRTHQCEIYGGSMIGGPSFRYRITDEGRRRALLFLENNHYVGVAPVPLAQYRAVSRSIPSTSCRGRCTRDACPRGVLASRAQPEGAGSARTRHRRRPLDVRLRPARQRQDRHRPGDPEPAGRRDRHPARHRGGGPNHPVVRPGQPRAARDDAGDAGPTVSLVNSRRDRQVGALPPADGDGRRRADARCAGPGVLADDGLLHRAGAGDGQRRRAGDRRLRPPALLAARTAEPLDRAAREPRRLPDACRPARSSSCRSACSWSSRPTSSRPSWWTKRSCAAFSTRCLPRARRALTSSRSSRTAAASAESGLRAGHGRSAAARTIIEPRGIQIRGCHPRDLIDQALAHAEYVGEPRQLTDRAAGGRMRRLFRGRHGARQRFRADGARRVSALVARVPALATATSRRLGFAAPVDAASTLRITSPLGRTGLPGTIRIVARLDGDRAGACRPRSTSTSTSMLLADDTDGPPYEAAVDRRQPVRASRDFRCSAELASGEVADRHRDLKPLSVTEAVEVTSVALEASVLDGKGRVRFANLTAVRLSGLRERRDPANRRGRRNGASRRCSCCWWTAARAWRCAPTPSARGRAAAARAARQDDQVVVAPFSRNMPR